MNNKEWFDGVSQQLEDDKKARGVPWFESHEASGRIGSGYYIRLKESAADLRFWLDGDMFTFDINGEVTSKYDGTEEFEVYPASMVTRDELILLVRIFCGVTLR